MARQTSGESAWSGGVTEKRTLGGRGARGWNVGAEGKEKKEAEPLELTSEMKVAAKQGEIVTVGRPGETPMEALLPAVQWGQHCCDVTLQRAAQAIRAGGEVPGADDVGGSS